MKTDLLTCRHNGIQEADLPIMLEKIGVGSVDELIDKTIPTNIRLQEPLPLAAPMTERQFAEHIADLAYQNKLYTSYRNSASSFSNAKCESKVPLRNLLPLQPEPYFLRASTPALTTSEWLVRPR